MIRINKWSDKFESADTRKRQRLGWFLSPTGCDSRGYRVIMRQELRGVIALGVFQSLCQFMGTLSKSVRKEGVFTNSDGSGMEVADLSEITRIKVADLESSLELLEEAGWITIESKGVKDEPADDVPDARHPPATHVPKDSGFVKGEGEEQGEDPLTPKGEWDGVFPRGSLSKPKTDQKKIQVLRPNEKMAFVGAWFNRRPETLWSVYEAASLRDLNPSKDDVLDMAKYRATPSEIHRTSVMTLLNNWSGELDRARSIKTSKPRNAGRDTCGVTSF